MSKQLFDPGKEPGARNTPVASAAECMICEKHFSYKDVKAGRFQWQTQVCSRCYAMLQDAPYEVSCFGKPTVIEDGKRKHLGYNPKTNECKRWCPDRKLCSYVLRVKVSKIQRT